MSDPAPPAPSTMDFQSPIEDFVARPVKHRYWLHVLLLLLTIFSTLVVGARLESNFLNNLSPFTAGDEFLAFFPIEWIWAQPSRLLLGIPFSACLLFILLTHEMGHYLYCRRYGIAATLPFFIPAPTPMGTLGAVIRIKSRIRSRAALFDIGFAGPIAGFVVAIIVLAVALAISKPVRAGAPPPDMALGYPLIFQLMHRFLSVIAPNLRATEVPLSQLNLHPAGVAAWVGMLATALNLLPSGQLDGGHMVYALWPRAHRWISWITVLFLAYLGWHYVGWRLWAALVAAMNILTWRLRQAPDFPSLGGNRWILAAVGLLMLILTFTIIPIHAQDLGWR